MKDTIKQYANKLVKQDGLYSTYISEIELFKSSKNFSAPMIYELCIIFVLSGKKIGKLSHKDLDFGLNNYLVVPTTIPLQCETFGSIEEPFIGLLVKIEKNVMYEIVETLSENISFNL